MDIGARILSQIVTFSKYSKYIPELKRRETWEDIVSRYEVMQMKKHPSLKKEVLKKAQYITDKKVLPSMRALQFAGAAAEINPARIYNCAYFPVDSVYAFSEGMFLLLGGSGVGYSVQNHHVEKLPEIIKPYKSKKYVVQDSIIGWADAVKVLMKSYFGKGAKPLFDFRDIRPKGARLITAGGKAPGPEPLKICLAHIEAILERKTNGDKLTPLECHDIMCHIANSVLSGGIRRAALLSLFSFDDEEMLTCKYGNWWELNEQRGRSNNSVCIDRRKISKEEFDILWKKIELSGSGEPGIYFTNNYDWGTNPCCFIGDTLVAVADGRNAISIKQLCDEGYKGPVYSIQTQTGQVVTSYCSNVWKSRENAELVKVLLDDGSSFTCTPDHRIMLRNGQYVQAQYLTSDTSLMPFNSFKRPDRDYRLIQSNTGRDIAQYAHVAQYYDIIKEGYDLQHIHHVDGNGLNDLPTNLAAIDASEHNRMHMLGDSNARFKMDDDTAKRWSEKQSNRQKGHNNVNSNGIPSDDLLERVHAATLRKRRKLTHKEILDICDVKFLSKGRLADMGATTVAELAESVFSDVNHKVVSVEFLDHVEDVYDMTIEGTHNFGIITSTQDDKYITSSGVFVHNCEIALRPFQFCNLCEINASDIADEQDLHDRVRMAAFFGTLQASFTDFHYLRPIWQKTTEKDALLGIGMTGIGSGEILKYDLKKAAQVAMDENERVAELIGINKAARVTCVKPSGTTSCVLGTSSGIHAWHDQYYLRTMRFNKNEDIAKYLMDNHPELCEDDVLRSHDTLCVRIPIKAPVDAILRNESPIELLERVKKFAIEWIKPGHRKGDNTHNVSATISIKEDEWNDVGEWMWENKNYYNGLSVLPYSGGSYTQAPFETITKEEYDRRAKTLQDIDLSNVIEDDDLVNFGAVAACAGGVACELDVV